MEVYIKKILEGCTLKDVYDCLRDGTITLVLLLLLSALPGIGYRNYVSSIQSKYAVSPFDGLPATSDINKETISKNIDIISGLQRDKWDKLPVQKRIDLMQTVANIEAQHLNIPYGIKVIALDSLPGDLFAFYDSKKHRIVINLDSLGFDPPIIVLESVCHEMRHCYQYVKADEYAAFSHLDKEIYQYEQEALIAKEFENYQLYSLDGNDEEYYIQLCEIEARKYSKYAVLYYLDAISEKH